MPKERLLIDKKDLVAEYFSGKTHSVADLAAEDIASVAIEPCKTGLFKNKEGKRIVITRCVPSEPIVYYSDKVKKEFDSYVTGLEKFCTDNRVKFNKACCCQ